MSATAPIPRTCQLTGTDTDWSLEKGRESEDDDLAHLPHHKQSDELEAIAIVFFDKAIQNNIFGHIKFIPLRYYSLFYNYRLNLFNLKKIKTAKNNKKVAFGGGGGGGGGGDGDDDGDDVDDDDDDGGGGDDDGGGGGGDGRRGINSLLDE
ncbi:hypothetical protein SprV_0602116700 [Sparganum proliferum]